MTDDKNHLERRRGGGRLVLGAFLLLLGALLLADNLGYDVPVRVWNFWPFLVLALGLVKLLWPSRPEERRSGYWMVVVGVWGAICVFGLFCLNWGNSWPIFVIAVGLSFVFDALVRGRRGAEADHVS